MSTRTTDIEIAGKPKRQKIVSKRTAQLQQIAEDKLKQEQDEQLNENNNDNDNDLCCIGPLDEETMNLPPIPRKFEYGDHTADIILHGYGTTVEECFESITYSMICYMFDYPERNSINPLLTHTITITGNSIPDLIFRYLTEILVQSINYYDELSTNIKKQIPEPSYPGMVPRLVRVLHYSEENTTPNENNNNNSIFKLKVEIQGDFVDTVKLGAGTEVKAITNELTRLDTLTDDEEIKNKGGKYHLQVLVDI